MTFYCCLSRELKSISQILVIMMKYNGRNCQKIFVSYHGLNDDKSFGFCSLLGLQNLCLGAQYRKKMKIEIIV